MRLFGTLYQTVNVLLQFVLRVLRVFAVISCVNVISLRGCVIDVITVPDLNVPNECSLLNNSRCYIAGVISLLFVKQFLSIVFNSKISLLAQARYSGLIHSCMGMPSPSALDEYVISSPFV